ncbi:hypothetical protein [Maricaulis salignorans]|uniref:hypothetical protein n=1 Tax=Maricaulis salignorans TaxID=144026 RepID=UPI003A904761
MKRVLMAAALVAMLCGLAPIGSVHAQHLPRLARADADAALAAIRLDGADNEVVSFERAVFRRGTYTFTNVVVNLERDAESPAGVVHAARMILDSPRLDSEGRLLLHAFVLEEVEQVLDAGAVGFTLGRVMLEAPNAEMSANLGRILRGDHGAEVGGDKDLYRFGLLAVDDAAEPGRTSDAGAPFAFDRLAFIGYTANTLQRFELLGFTARVENEAGINHLDMAELSVDGLMISSQFSVLDVFSAGPGDTGFFRSYLAMEMGEQLNLFDRLRVRNLTATIPGHRVTLDELVITMDQRDAVLDTRMRMGSLRIMPDLEDPAGAQLANRFGQLGYESLDLSLQGHSVYDPQSGRVFTTGENYLALRDGFRLDFAHDLGGYPEFLANQRGLSERPSATVDGKSASDAEGVSSAADPLVINRIALRLEDRSILERGFAAAAADQGITPEAMRSQAGVLVLVGLMSAPPEMPQTLVTQLATAVSAFIAQGGTLEIVMQPPFPVTIGEIRARHEAGAVDFEALGLGVTAEAPRGR